MKRRILLGTANQAKINRFRAYLATLPIEILSPGDLGIAKDVEEDGKTPQENAEIKARAYLAESNMPTLAVDAGLAIEKFPNEKQPGVFVRRIRGTGEAVSDEEILGTMPGNWTALVARLWANGRWALEVGDLRFADLLTC